MTITDDNAVDTTGTVGADASVPEKNRAEAIALFAIAFAAISILTAIFAVGIAARAVDRAEKGGGGGGTASGPSDVVAVTMSDFAFTPSDISLPAGGSIEFVNDASQPHDFHVEGGLSTPHVDGGDSFVLDVSELSAGTYDVWCEIPGHKDAGMRGTLTVT